MRALAPLLLLMCSVLASTVVAELPPADPDAAAKAAIDAAATAATKGSTIPDVKKQKEKKRERREPKDFFRHYNHDEANNYPELARRHMIVFSPADKMEENEALLMEAAEVILNPPPADLGDKGGNAGGGKVLFLLVDMSLPENAPLLHRCSVPTKSSKSGIIRIAQFPSKKPLQIFKPVGKYKISAKFCQSFLHDVRNNGDGATLALMSETKVKDFKSIDTSPTLLRAVGSTANFLVKRPEDVVLFSYLPSCSHCQAFNETFLQVAKECEARACGVKFVLFDGSLNEHSLVPNPKTTYPQVHMFRAHEKSQPIEFDDLANKVKGFRYFIDKERWFKDQPKLADPRDNGFELWDEEVDAMNALHFNSFLQRVRVFVVFFYAHTSQQSKLAMPEFAKAGEMLGFDKMPLLKINCEELGEKDELMNTKLCGMFGLTGYPSIMYVDTKDFQSGDDFTTHSELLEYHKYNAADIHEWLESKVSETSEKMAEKVRIAKQRVKEL